MSDRDAAAHRERISHAEFARFVREAREQRERADLLAAIVRDLHWQARRYCDGRRSTAPSSFNAHTRALLALGVVLNPTGDGTIWARDADGRGCDGLTDEEAAQGRPPDWWHSGPDARDISERAEAELAALRQSQGEG